MAITYNRLWKLLIDKDMSRVELRDEAQINRSTLAKMGKNQRVSLEVLERICHVLQCDFGQIIEYIDDKRRLDNDKQR